MAEAFHVRLDGGDDAAAQWPVFGDHAGDEAAPLVRFGDAAAVVNAMHAERLAGALFGRVVAWVVRMRLVQHFHAVFGRVQRLGGAVR